MRSAVVGTEGAIYFDPSGRLATISRGRVAFLDVAAAKAHPGVVEVMTAANRPPIQVDPDLRDQPFNFKMDVLQNDRVRYANQPIAVVIAETLEAATEEQRAVLRSALRARGLTAAA